MSCFRSAFSPRVRFCSPVGEGVEPIYTAVFLKGDARILKETGKRDVYAYIQSFKEESTVQRIVERYSKGDLSVLSRVQALYTDTSMLPGTLAEAFQKVIDAKNSFYSLTPEAQSYYGSPDAFVQRFANGDIFSPPVVTSEEDPVNA